MPNREDRARNLGKRYGSSAIRMAAPMTQRTGPSLFTLFWNCVSGAGDEKIKVGFRSLRSPIRQLFVIIRQIVDQACRVRIPHILGQRTHFSSAVVPVLGRMRNAGTC